MPDQGMPADVIAVGPVSGLQYVRLQASMAEAMEAMELAAFPTALPEDLYSAAELIDLSREFPQGTFVGFDGDGRVEPVACGLGIRVDFDLTSPQHNLHNLIDEADSASGDDPNGEWYYGTDIIVRPDYRRRGIGKELYNLRKQVCLDLGLKGIIAGGVIPGYAEHKKTMTADEYIDAVRAGELYDRTLTFQLGNGFDVLCALENYIKDPAVDNYASMIVWHARDEEDDSTSQGGSST